MNVSVVVCTYSTKFLGYLDKAVRSLMSQTYENLQIVVVVDGNSKLHKTISETKLAEWKSVRNDREIIITGHDKNMGLSYSRNRGIEAVDGDVIAFLDDDAVADENWISLLVEVYQSESAISAGGKILPIWEVEQPAFLPEECFWLIGVTHKGFPEEPGEVRNTFGSNMSFKREVFDEIGKFNEKLGRKGKKLLQGEETEIAIRMKTRYKKGVHYLPEAIVYHHIFLERVNFLNLLKRSFDHGHSKKILGLILKGEQYGTDDEKDFLNYILSTAIPKRVGKIFHDKPSMPHLKKLIFMISSVALVGTGYLWSTMLRK